MRALVIIVVLVVVVVVFIVGVVFIVVVVFMVVVDLIVVDVSPNTNRRLLHINSLANFYHLNEI